MDGISYQMVKVTLLPKGRIYKTHFLGTRRKQKKVSFGMPGIGTKRFGNIRCIGQLVYSFPKKGATTGSVESSYVDSANYRFWGYNRIPKQKADQPFLQDVARF
jgi:hypothetical protein